MTHLLYLAWRHICFYKVKTILLTLAVSFTFVFPLALQFLAKEFEQSLHARAQSTPLVIGDRGSRFDLTLHSLYFRGKVPGTVPFGAIEPIHHENLGVAVPLHVRFSVNGLPVVGTTLDYFEQRNLSIQTGELPVYLGDCVLGSEAAKNLKLDVGSKLIVVSKNIFDLTGSQSTALKVTGILAPSDSPDDKAAFVDIKTAWFIEGIGHGHQKIDASTNPETILKRSEKTTTVNEAIMKAAEVTEGNLKDFHFHGDMNTFPATAILVWPYNQKAGTILQGRFVGDDKSSQILNPQTVVQDLLGFFFQILQFFHAHSVMAIVSTLLFLALIILLSFRLRGREHKTLSFIGCSKGAVTILHFSELLFVFLFSVILSGIFVLLIVGNAPLILDWFL